MSDIVEEAQQLADMTDDFWLVFLKQDKKKVILAGAMIFAGAALAGGTTGWLLASRKLNAQYAERADREIAEAKAFYNTDRKAKMSLVSEEREPVVAEAADALLKYQGRGEPEDVSEPTVHVEVETDGGTIQNVNIFAQAEDGYKWDQPTEDAHRAQLAEGIPYVISEAEWSAGDLDYRQVTLTYYEGDQVLADEKDEPIPIVDEVVGEANLERFGHGTGDPKTVFIRNDKMSMDFEVIKHDGKFSVEVYGLQHSAYPMRHPNRRPRDVDEE